MILPSYVIEIRVLLFNFNDNVVFALIDHDHNF